MISAETPKVDQFGDFDAQRDAIVQVIRTTERLLDWLQAHRTEIREWSLIVDQEMPQGSQ
ncbi:hypothetical protein [Roseovarius gaetbuli]|uniref:hypothetical protein n=1 Tax=Roseovarius gaetbuli TaxID=1356575 RepID=UPI000A26903D|nr:hypothetical protein [Roseovarius gaetbuli]